LAGLPSGVTCSLGSKHARVGEGVERRGALISSIVLTVFLPITPASSIV
jgi:hypothetical protein